MATFSWILRPGHADEWDAVAGLVATQATAFGAQLFWAAETGLGSAPGGGAGARRLRAELADEETGRAFWLAVHEAADEMSLAVELLTEPAAADGPWRRLDAAAAESLVPSAAGAQLVPASAPRPDGLALVRPELPEETLYDLLLAQDPELAGKLDQTIGAIEAEGLPVIHLLPYLDLPLFQDYAAEHPGETEQNLFLHMLHTWTCYRRFGQVHAQLGEELAATLADSRWLRVHTTQFQSPAPALCVQFPPWWQPLRPAAAGPQQWVKEIYLTHCEPPTPIEDRELTLMIVTHDDRGEFAFVPLEIPLSLPAVEESLEAFFAPSLDDAQLGANSQDLWRTTRIAAAWCLYACARDPQRYLPPGAGA